MTASDVPVVVVGSVNIDLVAVGHRMPRPGETVSMERFAEVAGGKGGNQASAAAALGARVHFIGAVGSDHWGEAARADLAARGIDVSGLATVDGPTGVAIILVDDAGENSIAVIPGANAAVSPAMVTDALAALDLDDAVLVVCLEIPLESVVAAAVAAAARGWRVVLNPAPARDLPAELIAAATAITPNATELEQLGGVEALLAGGAGAVVVTLGGDGTELHPAGGAASRLAASPAASSTPPGPATPSPQRWPSGWRTAETSRMPWPGHPPPARSRPRASAPAARSPRPAQVDARRARSPRSG